MLWYSDPVRLGWERVGPNVSDYTDYLKVKLSNARLKQPYYDKLYFPLPCISYFQT